LLQKTQACARGVGKGAAELGIRSPQEAAEDSEGMWDVRSTWGREAKSPLHGEALGGR